MKPAYRPSPRIYRGQRRVAGPGRCPICERLVSINRSGVRRSHRDTHGFLCPGSGVQVASAPLRDYDPETVAAAMAQLEAARAQLRPPTAPPVRQKGDPPPGRCPECGQNPRLNKDGSLRAHRAESGAFTGPYCPGGGGKPRYLKNGGRP